MATFGELFPGAKLRKESPDDDGSGERFEAGPLDLDSGVVRLTPKPKPKQEPEDTD